MPSNFESVEQEIKKTNTRLDTHARTEEKVRHPFGVGPLTTTGIQYSTEKTGITHAAYAEVDKKTFYQPSGVILEEIEFGLTAAVKSSGATKAVLWKWQASDKGIDWEDLIAEQTRAADASSYGDVTISGRFAPIGRFLGIGRTFQVRLVIHAEDATETVSGKTKNSSYIYAKYRNA